MQLLYLYTVFVGYFILLPTISSKFSAWIRRISSIVLSDHAVLGSILLARLGDHRTKC